MCVRAWLLTLCAQDLQEYARGLGHTIFFFGPGADYENLDEGLCIFMPRDVPAGVPIPMTLNTVSGGLCLNGSLDGAVHMMHSWIMTAFAALIRLKRPPNFRCVCALLRVIEGDGLRWCECVETMFVFMTE